MVLQFIVEEESIKSLLKDKKFKITFIQYVYPKNACGDVKNFKFSMTFFKPRVIINSEDQILVRDSLNKAHKIVVDKSNSQINFLHGTDKLSYVLTEKNLNSLFNYFAVAKIYQRDKIYELPEVNYISEKKPKQNTNAKTKKNNLPKTFKHFFKNTNITRKATQKKKTKGTRNQQEQDLLKIIQLM